MFAKCEEESNQCIIRKAAAAAAAIDSIIDIPFLPNLYRLIISNNTLSSRTNE
jgi:hypothetical protein